MIRGSTPTHNFKLPIETDKIEKIRILYAQDDTVLFVKEIDDCKCDGCNVSVTLTQEETFKFNCKKLVQIQLRIKTINGDVIPSKETLVSVEKCLDNEVL